MRELNVMMTRNLNCLYENGLFLLKTGIKSEILVEQVIKDVM